MMKITMMTVSMYSMHSKNQMVMVTLIISTCCVLSATMFLLSNTHWFSILMVLIYVSGVMVLFMFIVSLSPNEKNSLKVSSKKTLILMMATASMMKITQNSENLKINSSFEWSFMLLHFMVLVIMIMAYMPPKIISSFYKGMKSTK